MRDRLEHMIAEIVPASSSSKEMREEFISHLTDAMEDYRNNGYSEEQAAELAMRDFGNRHDLRKGVICYMMQSKLDKITYSMWLFLVVAVIAFILTLKSQFYIPGALQFLFVLGVWRTLKLVFFSSLILAGIMFFWRKNLKKTLAAQSR